MRIKSVRGIVDEIKCVDSDSSVTQGMIWDMLDSKKNLRFHHGNRTVADLDQVIAAMNRTFGIDEDNGLPRIRSIHNAFVELRVVNPGLGISEEGMRFLVKEDLIPHICVGKKVLVALESFEAPYNEKFVHYDYCQGKKAKRDAILRELLVKKGLA